MQIKFIILSRRNIKNTKIRNNLLEMNVKCINDYDNCIEFMYMII